MLINSFQAVKAKQKQQSFREVIKSDCAFLSTFMELLLPRTTRILARIASWPRLVSSSGFYPEGSRIQVGIKLHYVSFPKNLCFCRLNYPQRMTNWSWEHSEFLIESCMRQGRENCLNNLHLVAWGSMGSTWLWVKIDQNWF